jgi:Fic family protein
MRGRVVTLTWEHEPSLQAPAKYRRACRYEAFIPDPLLGSDLTLSAEAAGVAAEAEAAIRDLNAHARPALAPHARLLLRTESIASSKVEGLQLGVGELARAEARMGTGGRVSPTAVEVMANIHAMELTIDEAASSGRLESKQILAIHRKLMERLSNPKIAGKLRTVQNWIGGNDYNPCGADFVPPPPEHVEELMEDLCAFLNHETLPPLVQAALLHAQFETIHPFDDGNGRTGRALIHVVLRRRGVAPAYVPPISVVLAAARERYIRGLTDYRADRTDLWIEGFSAAALRAARLASEYLSAVEDLAASWRASLSASPKAPRAGAAAWAIIDVLPGHPIITAPVAAVATDRSKPQIYQGLAQLESAGVLVPLSSGKRNQSWEAVGLLELLSGLEAGEPLTGMAD